MNKVYSVGEPDRKYRSLSQRVLMHFMVCLGLSSFSSGPQAPEDAPLPPNALSVVSGQVLIESTDGIDSMTGRPFKQLTSERAWNYTLTSTSGSAFTADNERVVFISSDGLGRSALMIGDVRGDKLVVVDSLPKNEYI